MRSDNAASMEELRAKGKSIVCPHTGATVRLRDIPPFAGELGSSSLGSGKIGLWELRGTMLADVVNSHTEAGSMTGTHEDTDSVSIDVFGRFSVEGLERLGATLAAELGDEALGTEVARALLVARASLVEACACDVHVGGKGFVTACGDSFSPESRMTAHPLRFDLRSSGRIERVNLPASQRTAIGIPPFVLAPAQSLNHAAPRMNFVFMHHHPAMVPSEFTDEQNDAMDLVVRHLMYMVTKPDAQDFATALHYIRQGGFKYTEEKRVHDGFYTAVRSGSMVMGSSDATGRAPLKTGLRERLPLLNFMTDKMQPVSLPALRDMGYTRYAMIPSGCALVLVDAEGRHSLWYGAPFGGFVERGPGKVGADVFAFGVDEDAQRRTHEERVCTRDVSDCVICYGARATMGYRHTGAGAIYCAACAARQEVRALLDCPKTRKTLEGHAIEVLER